MDAVVRPDHHLADLAAAAARTSGTRSPRPTTRVGRRPAVGDFVADIPFAAGHPSRPALDRIADGIAGLEVPALLLWGPRDPVFLEEHLRDLQERLPQAVLHRYEKASHLLPEDAPGYAAAVADWVHWTGRRRFDAAGVRGPRR